VAQQEAGYGPAEQSHQCDFHIGPRLGKKVGVPKMKGRSQTSSKGRSFKTMAVKAGKKYPATFFECHNYFLMCRNFFLGSPQLLAGSEYSAGSTQTGPSAPVASSLALIGLCSHHHPLPPSSPRIRRPGTRNR